MKSRINQADAKSRKKYLKLILKKNGQASYAELRKKVGKKFPGLAPVSNSLIAECKKALNLLNIERIRSSPREALQDGVEAIGEAHVAIPAQVAEAISKCKKVMAKHSYQAITIDLDEGSTRLGRRKMDWTAI